jgi:hypothetical protein
LREQAHSISEVSSSHGVNRRVRDARHLLGSNTDIPSKKSILFLVIKSIKSKLND